MTETIHSINPAESPFLVVGNSAERTVLKFSNNDKRIAAWVKRRARERILNPRYEWKVDSKPA